MTNLCVSPSTQQNLEPVNAAMGQGSLMLMQPGVSGAGVAGKGPLPSTWSDHAVNISLDFLGPGAHPPKPNQPSLNTLQQGEEWMGSYAQHNRFMSKEGDETVGWMGCTNPTRQVLRSIPDVCSSSGAGMGNFHD